MRPLPEALYSRLVKEVFDEPLRRRRKRQGAAPPSGVWCHLSSHLVQGPPSAEPPPKDSEAASSLVRNGDYWHQPPPERGDSFHSSEDFDDVDEENEDEEKLALGATEISVGYRLSVELYVYGAHYADVPEVQHYQYLRDALVSGFRYDHDYCLEQNLFRFKSKMVIGNKDALFKWKSYDAYIRRTNAYHDELHAFISHLKRDLLPAGAWRAPAAKARHFLWHEGEFAPFNDKAVALVHQFDATLCRKYPIRDAAHRCTMDAAKGVSRSPALGRRAFGQRDRQLFVLFRMFLTEPVHDERNNRTVHLPPRSYHADVADLDGRALGYPCLVYAATDALRKAADVAKECAVPRQLPGLRSNCCARRCLDRADAVPWFSGLAANAAPVSPSP